MGGIGPGSNTGDMMVGRVRTFTNKQPIEYICSRVVETSYGVNISPSPVLLPKVRGGLWTIKRLC